MRYVIWTCLVAAGVGFGCAAPAETPISRVINTRDITTGRVSRPNYSADSSYIYFDRTDSAGNFQVRRMPTGGGTEECLTCGYGDLPGHNGSGRPHPSGRYIVFTSEKATHASSPAATITPGAGFYSDIVVMDLTTRERFRVREVRAFPTPGVSPPDPGGTLYLRFSPDGSKLLFADVENIGTAGLVPASRFGNFRLGIADFVTTPTPRLENLQFFNPGGRPEFFEVQGWSPDSASVYTACTPRLGQNDNAMDFCRFDWQANRLVGVSGTSGLDGEPAEFEEHGMPSPDGKWVAYMSSRGHGIDPNRFFLFWLRTDLWISDPDGNSPQQMTFYNVPGHPESDPRGHRVIVSEMGFRPDSQAVLVQVYYVGNELSGADDEVVLRELELEM